MSMNPAARNALYKEFASLNVKLQQKQSDRLNAERALGQIDTEIAALCAQRQEIADHALASGEDFGAAEREQIMLAQMGRETYDPVGY